MGIRGKVEHLNKLKKRRQGDMPRTSFFMEGEYMSIRAPTNTR